MMESSIFSIMKKEVGELKKNGMKPEKMIE